MAKTITTKFKKLYKSEIAPKLKQKDKLYSEINKLNSEKDNLYLEINKFYSKIDKLHSEIDKLKFYSKIDKLHSEIDKLDSEIDKIYSKILMIFYKFGKSNNCQVMWRGYDFKLEEIELKTYNKDKTGFIFLDMNGNEREELFEPKPDEYKVINGHKYKLVE
ncbi:MAG: coiled-coil domain-containing protein [Promethearchaeota archaeon]